VISRRPALVALAAACLLACQTTLPRDPGVAIDPADPRATALLAEQGERAAQREALRASLRMSLEAPGLSFSRPQRLVVQRPASLRLEVLALFDQVAGVVATDGVRFAFVDLTSGARAAGPVDDGVLWRTARVDLTPADAVALMLGVPVVAPDAPVVAARAFEDGGIGVSTGDVDPSGTRYLEWGAAGELRRAELRSGSGERVWTARFSDWRDLEGSRFAYQLELDFPRVDARASLRFDIVELEPALSPGVFVLQVPPGG